MVYTTIYQIEFFYSKFDCSMLFMNGMHAEKLYRLVQLSMNIVYVGLQTYFQTF